MLLLNFEQRVNAVFSNAVLHWIPEKEKVVKYLSEVLKTGGRFVAEFGGKNNIRNVVDALSSILMKNGYPDNAERINWYFPSIGEYASLLEKYGFEVEFAAHFKRDTFLDDGIDIIDWLEMFGKEIFSGIEPGMRLNLLAKIKDNLSGKNIKDGKWFIDYKRLRIAAVKES